MAKKFLETLTRYAKEMGLSEAVPGSTNVMTPPVTGNPAGQMNNNVGAMTVDELAKQEQDHVKTTNDINSRIQSGHATEEDYSALQAATASLSQIAQAKAKLNTQTGKPVAGATGSSGAPTNPLVKPLV